MEHVLAADCGDLYRNLVTGPAGGDLLAHCCCGGVGAALGLGLGVGHAFFGGMGVRN